MTDVALAARLRAMAASLIAEAVVQEAPPRSITFTNQPGSRTEAVAGQGVMVMATIKSVGVARLLVSAVSPKVGNPFVGTVQSVPTTGLVTVTVQLTEDKGFIKAIDADDKSLPPLSKDSEPVSLALKPVPVPVPVPATPQVTVPVTVPATAGGAGLKEAKALRDRLVFGINWERERFCANYTYDAAHSAYLDGIGVTHLRGFVPWKPSGVNDNGTMRQFWDLAIGKAPTKDQFNRFRPNAKAIVQSGKPLFLDFLDVVGVEDFTDSLRPIVDQYISDAAGWVAEWQLGPLLIVGSTNEWAGGDNPTYQAHRTRLLGLIRAKLPNNILSEAPAYWGHYSSFLGDSRGKYVPSPDLGTLQMWHAYDRNSAAGWAGAQAGMDAWSLANGGRPIVNGELGPGGLYDGKDFNAGDGGWISHITRQNPALANSAPCLWACTEGDWKMSRGFNDPRLWDGSQGWDPKIEQAVKAAAAANKLARKL